VSNGAVGVDMCGSSSDSRWAGRHVLLVEDIIDSGNTLCRLAGAVASCGADSVKVVALLDKKVRRPRPRRTRGSARGPTRTISRQGPRACALSSRGRRRRPRLLSGR
jgi:orotate phosphoribosyltransferase